MIHQWPPLVRVLPNHFRYLDEFGEVRVMGEVQNGSPGMVTYVNVPVSLLDDVGQVLATDEAGVHLYRLAPGTKRCPSLPFTAIKDFTILHLGTTGLRGRCATTIVRGRYM